MQGDGRLQRAESWEQALMVCCGLTNHLLWDLLMWAIAQRVVPRCYWPSMTYLWVENYCINSSDDTATRGGINRLA